MSGLTVQASSNEGDVVLDPFCSCGTTIAAAQKLGLTWIGIDVTHLAVGLMKLRLKDSFGMLPVGTKAVKPGTQAPSPASVLLQDADERCENASRGNVSAVTPEEPALQAGAPAFPGESSPPYEGGVAPASGDGVVLSTASDQRSVNKDAENHPVGETPTPLLRKEGSLGGTYKVIGQPEDLDGARELALNDRYGFQWWILPLIGARALGAEKGQKEGKKGSDKGIDGIMVFTDDNSGKAKRVIVSVKSGHVNVAHIRDLGHVIDRENAAIGVYLTLEPPTKPMIEEAVEKGFYQSPGWNKDYPRLQILTVEDILNGKTVDLPPNLDTYKQAQRIVSASDDQRSLGFE